MFKNISFIQILVVVISLLFFSSASFFLGIYTEKNNFIKNNSQNIKIFNSEDFQNKTVPTISLNQIQNGILEISKINKINNNTINNNFELRVLLNNKPETLQIFAKDTQKLDFNVVEILPKIDFVPAPNWAKFVGSKRGSTFWPLDHPRAFILTPKNRIFFKDKQDAINKKYKYGVQ